ncbi:hypothetical protein DSTSK_03390 [Desulforhabdus sp. TSK]|nr:hypothetical protein DSTSK_03390 [Desulforhabdus sp. TSK]
MLSETSRFRMFWILGLLGLFISLLAGLAGYFPWLQSLCTGFGGGCKETVEVSLLYLPLWVWGAGFYLVLTLSALRFRGWLPWVLAAGIGVEIALVWFMISLKMLCIICVGNFLVLVLLFIVAASTLQFWQTVSIVQIFFIAGFFILSHENKGMGSHGSPAENGLRVVARIGEEVITRQELEGPLNARIFPMEQEVYRLKRERLDELIREKLLEKAAQEQGVPPEKFIEANVLNKPIEVSDEEIEGYQQENAERLKSWRGSPEELRGRIKGYLEQLKKIQQVKEYARTLEPRYGVTVLLEEPKPVLTQVDLEGSPSLGPDDAKILVVEYSDYQCSACRSSHGVVRQIREAFAGKIRWVFKDLPLKMHKDAKKAAQAAHCAAEQNKFWEYQDILYTTPDGLGQEQLEKAAVQVGLAPEAFRQCLESGRHAEAIEREVAEAKKVGIESTPSFIINGKIIVGGPSFEGFKQYIEEELKAVQAGS